MSKAVATDCFRFLPRFRMTGSERFSASCPTSAHPHGDRSRGLSGRIIGDKIVIKCFAGCDTEDILAAIGLDWSALFLDDGKSSRTPRQYDPDLGLRCDGAAERRKGREKEMMRCATQLRERDGLIHQIGNCVNGGTLSTDDALGMLSYQYHGYSEVEEQFETLRAGTDEEVRELWSVANVE